MTPIFDHLLNTGLQPVAHTNQTQTKYMMDSNQLTPRETEVLNQLREGHTYKEIANALKISEETVRKHATNIYTKLDVKNRTQAIKKYFKQ